MVVIVVSSKWFSFSSFFKWLNADFKESMAMRLDIKSATALAPHTPFNPKRFGKITFIHVQVFPAMLSNIINKNRRIPLLAIAIRFESLVKIFESIAGKT